MPLSLDAIRNFAGNDRILVDARTGTVQSENKLQRFKSFFDIGDARQRNAETLSMIHHAFLNDPRFASRDLQSAAVRMLAQVRTDRAIGAAQLRGIADELFRLSGEGAGNGVDAVIRERVALHLAARGLPPLLDGIRERVVAFVADRIAADANVLAHPGSADVAGMANDLVDLCCAAARELQNGPRGVPDPRLLSVFGDNLGELLTDHNGAVRPDQDIADRLGRVRDFFQAAVDRAEQTGEPGLPDVAAEFLRAFKKPPDPGLFDRLDAFARGVPVHDLARLGPGSSADEIFAAFHDYARFVHERPLLGDDGNPLFSADPHVTQAVGRFVAGHAALRIPEAARRSILAALDTPAGARAFDCIAHDAALNQTAYADHATTGRLVTVLQRAEGRPEGLPGAINNERPGARPRGRARPPFDFTGFSPASRIAYDPEKAFAGAGAPRLRSAVFAPLSDALGLVGRGNAAGVFRARLADGARPILAGAFAKGMKALASGGAFAPGVSVSLPGGGTLPADPAAARDVLARLATGRDDASYAALPPADRARADVLLSLLSAAAADAAEAGVSRALSPDGDRAALQPRGGPAPERRFVLSGSAEEGFHVRCLSHREPSSVAVPGAGGTVEAVPAGPGSSVDVQTDLFLSPADMDRLASADWNAFDPSAFDAALARGRAAPDVLENAVPAGFRLGGELAAAFHANVAGQPGAVDRRAAFAETVSASLGAKGFPDFARGGLEGPYRELATLFLAARAPQGAGGAPDFAAVDVAGGLLELEDLVQRLVDRMGGRKEAVESLLRRAPALFVDGSTNEVLPQDRLEEIADGLRETFDALQAAADERGLDLPVLLSALEVAGADVPAPDAAGRAARAGAFAASSLRGLGADSSATAVHDALDALAMALQGTPAERALAAGAAVAALSPADRAGLDAALRTPAARNLLAFYGARAFGTPPDPLARAFAEAAFAVDARLRAAGAGGLDPVSAADSVDPAAVPVAALAAFSAPPEFSGGGVGPVRGRFAANDAALGGALAGRMRESAADQVAISIAKLMAGEPDLDNPAKDGPQEQFFGDLHRGPLNNEPFLLPDGPLPANDDGAARDRIVRFLSGRTDATWAGADPGLKRKAVVLMACCNQSLGGIALSSIGEAFDPAHASPLGIGFMPANPTGRQPLPRESSYRISMDPDGSVRIRYLWKQPVMAVLPEMEWLGPGSFWEVSAEIRIPQADLDRYADFQWSSFDVGSLAKAETGGGFDAHRAAADTLIRDDGQDCRFTGAVSLGCRFHHVPGQRPDNL